MTYKIISYDHFGRGIAKSDGKVLFIPNTKIGEDVNALVVKDKKNYSILKRIDEIHVSYCPYYSTCGGCQIGHLSFSEQLEFKQKKALNILEKYAGIKKKSIKIIPTSNFNYRNKVVFHIKKDKIGFYEEESNKLLEIDKCPLLDNKINEILLDIKEFIKDNNYLTEVMVRVFNNEVMLSFKGECNDNRLINYFKDKVTSLYHNDKLITGTGKIKTKIIDKEFLVSPKSFFQVNNDGVVKIYQEVINFIKKIDAKKVLDLYCGTGTISIMISDYVKEVLGIEIVKDAVIDALDNKDINKIDNVKFKAISTSIFMKDLTTSFDTVIVDPPRSGLDKVTRDVLLKMGSVNIIYVSCDLMSLSRDLKILSDKYLVKEILLVDEFPNTYHVESISLLIKK